MTQDTGVIGAVEGAAMSFEDFLNSHLAQMETIGAALGAVADAIPFNQQDKSTINNAIGWLQNEAVIVRNNLASILGGAPSSSGGSGGSVTVKESDIETAVRNVLNSNPDWLNPAINAAVANHMGGGDVAQSGDAVQNTGDQPAPTGATGADPTDASASQAGLAPEAAAGSHSSAEGQR